MAEAVRELIATQEEWLPEPHRNDRERNGWQRNYAHLGIEPEI